MNEEKETIEIEESNEKEKMSGLVSDLVEAFKIQLYLNKITTEQVLELKERVTKLETLLGVYTDVPKS